MKKNIEFLNRITHYERELVLTKEYLNLDLEKLFKKIDGSYRESLEGEMDYNLYNGQYPKSFTRSKAIIDYMRKVSGDISRGVHRVYEGAGGIGAWSDGELPSAILNDKDFESHINLIYHMYCFKRAHTKVYKLRNNFIDILDTETKEDWADTKFCEVRVPAKSIYIPLPPKVGVHTKNGSHRTCGVYVNWLSETKGTTIYKLLFAYFAKKREDVKHESSQGITIECPDDKTIKWCLDDYITGTTSVFREDEGFRRVLEIIFKTLLYVGCVGAVIDKKEGIKYNPSPRELKRKLNKLPSSLDSYVLGGDIKIQPPNESSGNASGAGGVKRRHYVRGFFNTFWVNYHKGISPDKILEWGEKWTKNENKVKIRKYIQPHFRGKGIAEIIHKNYSLEG